MGAAAGARGDGLSLSDVHCRGCEDNIDGGGAIYNGSGSNWIVADGVVGDDDGQNVGVLG